MAGWDPIRKAFRYFNAETIPAAAGDTVVGAAGAAAVITYAAVPGRCHTVLGVQWSYSAAPGAGSGLKIEDVAGNIVFQVDITAAGPGSVLFARPKKGAAVNTVMIVTLIGPGTTVVGKLNVEHRIETLNPPVGS